MSSPRSKAHVAPFVGPAWYVGAAWLVAAVLVQATVLHFLQFHNVVPSVVLLVVVWYAIRADAVRATIYGAAAGFCEDALSAQSGGAWTIATASSALAVSRLSRGFFADSTALATTITVMATLLRALIFWIVMAFSGYPGGLGTIHFHQALLQAAINAALMAVVMLIERRFDRTSS